MQEQVDVKKSTTLIKQNKNGYPNFTTNSLFNQTGLVKN